MYVQNKSDPGMEDFNFFQRLIDITNDILSIIKLPEAQIIN